MLLDFGSARQAIGARSRSVTSIITPGYAPIEQYSSRGDQGPWTDIYALGGVCYRALTGAVPEDATDRVRNDPLIPVVERCAGQVSAEFLSAIDWALAVDEGDRPQSIAEWCVALERNPSKKEEIGTDDEIDWRREKDSKGNLRESPEATHRLNMWFRLGVCLGLLANTIFLILDTRVFFITYLEGLGLILTYLLFLIISFLCGDYILHKLWSLIPADEAKTTPGKAVGFLFIPFFNLYWNFIAIYDLAQALDSLSTRRGIKKKKVSKGLCLAFCIFFTFNLLIFHLITLLLCGVDVLKALFSKEWFSFFIFFTFPTNIVLGIIMFKQIKNMGIALIEGVEQEGNEDG